MKRILMVGQMSIVGGQQSFIMNYFRKIDRSRYHVDFLGVHGNSSPYEDEINQLGGAIFYWNKTFGFTELLKNLIELVSFIKKGNYDVVHANIYLGNCWFLVAAFIAGVRIRISHSHCTFPLYEEGENKIKRIYHSVIQKYILLACSTRLIACGEAAGRALYGSKKFYVLNNSIDVPKYYAINESVINKLNIEFELYKFNKIYASISRFDENKNLSFVIDVFEEIVKDCPDCLLILGGAEPYDFSTRSIIEKRIENCNLYKNVKLVSTRNDLQDLMQIIDCWLLPSFHEGLPIIGIELQAASVPIIASDTITKEMDMGLGLVSYLPLDNKKLWVNSAKKKSKYFLSVRDIQDAFQKHGYDIYSSIKELEYYYNEN